MNTQKRNYRRIGAYTLMMLSAFSMICQYALQGILAINHPTSDLPMWFWPVDWILWAARALIEAVVILYLFETDAETDRDRRLLAMFEIVLIVLIVVTVAPAIRAQGLGMTMPQSVPDWFFTLWTVGLAAYTPLMMGGLATALRVQPGVTESVPATEHATLKARFEELRQSVGQFRLERAANETELAQLRLENAAHQARLERLRSDEATKSASALARALLTEVYDNGSAPDVQVIAKMLQVRDQTIRKARADAKETQERLPGINGE